MTQKITIKEVLSKKELRLFIRFPRKLYANSPNYVPALDNDEYQTLTKHPALDFCSLRLWLAYRDGKVVGRIAAIINHKHNELKQQKRIRFGWFDVINDEEVAQLLFSKVEQWGIENELTEISGPSRFSNMEKQGLLIEGFDKMPPISSEYNFD
ncbi:MAG TPA: N-acetyltransferase, partial [Bacteroidales bacterium]|nr:N-acetyltransferase [Bacteroidales bacterium]